MSYQRHDGGEEGVLVVETVTVGIMTDQLAGEAHMGRGDGLTEIQESSGVGTSSEEEIKSVWRLTR